MRLLALVASILFSTNVFAVSLDDAWNAQTQETITPVKIREFFVEAEQNVVPGLNNASEVCGSLGYSRVVNFDTERCTSGDKIVGFYPGLRAAAAGISDPRSCLSRGGLRLKSVTCAR